MFWKATPPAGTAVDPVRESARLRQNAALGQPENTGDTPIIQPPKTSFLGSICSREQPVMRGSAALLPLRRHSPALPSPASPPIARLHAQTRRRLGPTRIADSYVGREWNGGVMACARTEFTLRRRGPDRPLLDRRLGRPVRGRSEGFPAGDRP